jgi:hypothetical protein
MKTKLAQAKVIQTIHPVIAIKQKAKERKQSKRKQTSHPKEKFEEQ